MTDAFANVTIPGPLTLLQVIAMLLPDGNPSSLTLPFKLAFAGNVMV